MSHVVSNELLRLHGGWDKAHLALSLQLPPKDRYDDPSCFSPIAVQLLRPDIPLNVSSFLFADNFLHDSESICGDEVSQDGLGVTPDLETCRFPVKMLTHFLDGLMVDTVYFDRYRILVGELGLDDLLPNLGNYRWLFAKESIGKPRYRTVFEAMPIDQKVRYSKIAVPIAVTLWKELHGYGKQIETFTRIMDEIYWYRYLGDKSHLEPAPLTQA